MKTLDSILTVAKAVVGTAGASLTGLLAADVIPLPDGWRQTATAAAGALTGFSVWLTGNKKTIEDDANKLVGLLGKVDPSLAAELAWAVTPDDVSPDGTRIG